jgi:hypothetical protein
MLLILGMPPKLPEALAIAQTQTVVWRTPINGLSHVFEELIGIGFLLR